jgi:hypothetical protein
MLRVWTTDPGKMFPGNGDSWIDLGGFHDSGTYFAARLAGEICEWA